MELSEAAVSVQQCDKKVSSDQMAVLYLFKRKAEPKEGEGYNLTSILI